MSKAHSIHVGMPDQLFGWTLIWGFYYLPWHRGGKTMNPHSPFMFYRAVRCNNGAILWPYKGCVKVLQTRFTLSLFQSLFSSFSLVIYFLFYMTLKKQDSILRAVLDLQHFWITFFFPVWSNWQHLHPETWSKDGRSWIFSDEYPWSYQFYSAFPSQT